MGGERGMVKIGTDISGKREISSEKNSSSDCEKCISEILNCLIGNHITFEVSYEILNECKERIRIMGEQTTLTNQL